MKRKLLLITMLAVVALFAFAACGSRNGDGEGTTPADPGTPSDTTGTDVPGREAPVNVDTQEGQVQINLWSFTDEVPNMVAEFTRRNPDFAERYNVVSTIISTDDGAYQLALDMALAGGGSEIPDLFTAEAAFVVKYTQGDMSQFAMPYSDLGIADLAGRISSAEIAPYTVELGSRGNDVVGLAFQMTGSAMIYRRDLAMQVWGNDDPDFVGSRVGPGWDRFFEAAADMAAEGISMVSGSGDIWQAVRNTGGPWIVNGRLNIHPDRMAQFEYSRMLYENGWMNDAEAWSSAWFADMSGTGDRPVFCFLGPAWLINYVMAGNSGDTYGNWAIAVPPVGFSWGGTWLIPNANMNPDARDGVRQIVEWITLDTSPDGLQHHWANGTLFGEGGTKDAVSSATIMRGADGSLPFLGGQDMFDVFVPAGAFADGTLFTQYDENINSLFLQHTMYYARGDMSREEAEEAFRAMMRENLELE